MATRRKFSDEYKREAVRLATQPGVTKSQVASELGINANLLGRWCKDFSTNGAAIRSAERTIEDQEENDGRKASVPEFDRTDPVIWAPTGKYETLELALVGMHIVGTVLGHPEMVWATFEHRTDSPNNTYYYRDEKEKLNRVDFDSTGEWLFMPTDGPKRKDHYAPIKSDSYGNIVSDSGKPIKPVPV